MALAIVVALIQKLQLCPLPENHPDLDNEGENQGDEGGPKGGRQATGNLKQALFDRVQRRILPLKNTSKSGDRKRQTLCGPDEPQYRHAPDKSLHQGETVDHGVFVVLRLPP